MSDQEKRVSGRTAGVLALVVAGGGGAAAANADDISRILNQVSDVRPPPGPVVKPPLVVKPPVIVPLLPAVNLQLIRGQFQETPAWWDDFVDVLIDRAPDAVDYLDYVDKIADAMASTRCTARQGGPTIREAAEASALRYDVPAWAVDPITSEVERRWDDLGLMVSCGG